MKYNHKILAFALTLIFCAPVPAGDEVDGYVKTRMRWLHIPGVSLAVIRNGRVIKMKGFGFPSG